MEKLPALQYVDGDTLCVFKQDLGWRECRFMCNGFVTIYPKGTSVINIPHRDYNIPHVVSKFKKLGFTEVCAVRGATIQDDIKHFLDHA